MVKGRAAWIWIAGALAGSLALSQIPRLAGNPETLEYFVSTNGNDASSGGNATPFATLARARDAVRGAKVTHPHARIRVTVHGGAYYLPSTLVFTPEDSGTPDAPIVWQAAPGEAVLLSGGRKIQAQWTTADGKIYSADVPDARGGGWDFDQLFVNDHRAVKARYPNLLPNDLDGKSWIYVGGQHQDRILAGLARNGDFLEYGFNVPVAGEYNLWLGVSRKGNRRPRRIVDRWQASSRDRHHGQPIVSQGTIHAPGKTPAERRTAYHSHRQRQRQRVSRPSQPFDPERPVRFGDSRLPGPTGDSAGTSHRSTSGRPVIHKGRIQFHRLPLFVPEEGPAPDHFSIHADPDRIKASWASDPEARVNLVAGLQYFNEILKIDSIDAQHGVVRVSGKETQEIIHNGNYFFVSGAREELDTPGEWYLDSRAGRLYYWPLEGEDPNRSTFIAPKLDRLIELAGDLDGSARVRWLEFRGFTFEHSAANTGYIALRTPADAAVRLNGAWNCTIESCRFRNIDAYGIWLHLDSCENTIDGNTIEEMGGGGIVLTSARMGYGEVFDSRPSVAGYAPLRNRFTRNHIHHGGRVRSLRGVPSRYSSSFHRARAGQPDRL